MKALVFERSALRYAAARVASAVTVPGVGARVGPLHLQEVPEPVALDRPGWVRVRPRLGGICGSDLATIDGRSTRYFEPVVSFPFTPGHEVVGDLDDGRRVVIEPTLTCAARGVDPPCAQCAVGRTGNCERITVGHVAPGLQTGYCADTGGGWGIALAAHESQLHPVPDDLSDEAAVVVEPAACAVHAALLTPVRDGGVFVVLGAGTLGLCVVAALRRFTLPTTIIATAKHPHQRRLAADLGADVVVEPGEVRRAVRRNGWHQMIGPRLAGGADVVIDCVGTGSSIEDALAVVAPSAWVVLVGMPGRVSVDLTALWHRETRLVGSYAYGYEPALGRRTFDLAFELVRHSRLDQLVSARYPLDRYREAIEHAADAGRRGAVKVVFDLREERERERERRR